MLKLSMEQRLIGEEVLIKGNKMVDAAKKFSRHPGSISRIIRRIKENDELLQQFRERKADIFDYNQLRRQEVQDEILDSINLKEIKDAKLGQKITALNLLGMDKAREFEQGRLQRGESTENVAVIVGMIKKMKEAEDG